MRRRINTITLILYFVFFAGAVFFGWYDVKTIGSTFRAWPICVGCLLAMLITGIVRLCLLYKDKQNSIESQTIRDVTVAETKVEGNKNCCFSITDELPLVHVDNVDSNKIVISLYKEKSLLLDTISKITK